MFEDRRIILIIVLMGLGAIFCVYKAISAFSVHDVSPSLPSPAFVSPPRAHITQDQYVSAPRLPDDIESAVLSSSRQLTLSALSLQLGEQPLLRAGMTQRQAAATVSTLSGVRTQLIGHKVQPSRASVDLSAVQGTEAVVVVNLAVYDPRGLEAPKPVKATFVWRAPDSYWSRAHLASMQLSVAGS